MKVPISHHTFMTKFFKALVEIGISTVEMILCDFKVLFKPRAQPQRLTMLNSSINALIMRSHSVLDRYQRKRTLKEMECERSN